MSKIFERFYQTDSTINGQQPGTGIGLDLAKSLVELHHGTISAHNLEKGCEFVVTLPLGDKHLKPEEKITDTLILDTDEHEQLPLELEQQDATDERKQQDRFTIVIAEDDDEIRQLLSQELGQDYDVKALSLIHI